MFEISQKLESVREGITLYVQDNV